VDAVLGVVADGLVLLVERAQVLGHEREGAVQQVHPRRVQDGQVEGCHEPLVRVEHKRVRPLTTIEDVAEFGDDRGRTCIGGIDVQPEPFALTQLGNGRHGVDA
jgi:hypothetical protein